MDRQQVMTRLQNDPALADKANLAMQQVLARSATDYDYRQRLLANPSAAISEVTGVPVPADTKIVFLENKADATLVLPAPVAGTNEISEAELEVVNGGCTIPTGGLVITTLSIVAELINIWTDGGDNSGKNS
jgi:hypothetical protein